MASINKSDLNNAGLAIKKAADDLMASLKSLADDGEHIDRNMPQAVDPKDVQAKFDTIVAAYRDCENKLTPLRDSINALHALLGLNPPLAAAERTVARPPASESEKSSNFADFLTSVGESVLTAQRQLDARSRTYIGETAQSDFGIPSAFRIPKLSGKMMVELEFEKEWGVNLIFNSRSDRATQRNQQAIEFDIVSVPAPPGALDSVRSAAGLELVFDQAVRKLLLDSKPEKTTDALPPEALEDISRILILRRTIQTEKETTYLVVYAGQEDKPSAVGMWILTGGVLKVIYRFQRQNGDFEDRLKSFASKIADAQKNVLGAAG